MIRLGKYKEGRSIEDAGESLESEGLGQEILEENSQDSEYNDLAEDYLNALEQEDAEISYYENTSSSNGGNVTVVGSQRN